MKIFEVVNNKNIELLRYLSDSPDQMSAEEIWPHFTRWAVYYDDGSGEIVDIIEKITSVEISAEDYDDEIENMAVVDADTYHKVPEKYRKEFIQDNSDLFDDSEESQTRQSFRLENKKLLPNDTILIHFTNNPIEIEQKGFMYGVPYVSHLGETVRLPDHVKSGVGYNFAYVYDESKPLDAYALQKGAWKRDSYVIFRGTGVHVFHFGDRERQVIFWGGYVDPSDIIKTG